MRSSKVVQQHLLRPGNHDGEQRGGIEAAMMGQRAQKQLQEEQDRPTSRQGDVEGL